MSIDLKKYIKRIKLFSNTEKVYLIVYSILSIILDRLPKNLISTFKIYKEASETTFSVEKKKKNNLIFFSLNSSELRLLLKRNSSDPLVFKQIFMDDEYLPVVNIIKERKINCNRIIDAGANIGCASLYFHKYFPNADIIALEPNKKTFSRLKENVSLNNSKSIDLIEEGIWNTNTYLSGNNSFRDNNDWSFNLQENDVSTQGSIKCTTIQTLLDQYKWQNIDLLKLDIEGGEDAVFKSAEEVKNWLPKIMIIAIEIHDEFQCRDRIYNILKEYNFEIIETPEGLTIGVNNSHTYN